MSDVDSVATAMRSLTAYVLNDSSLQHDLLSQLSTHLTRTADLMHQLALEVGRVKEQLAKLASDRGDPPDTEWWRN
jgi:hypothetical protein